MLELGVFGGKPNILYKRGLFLSKYLTLNSYTLPTCRQIRIVFPLYNSEGLIRSKGVLVMLDFLEQISGLSSIIKKVNFISGSGLWLRGQVNLASFNLMRFYLFFNEFLLSHPLLRYVSRAPFLRVISKNIVKLTLSELDFFFDAYTRRVLPHSKFYWIEVDFFFENKFNLENFTSIYFYTQYFFSHDLLEWRNG